MVFSFKNDEFQFERNDKIRSGCSSRGFNLRSREEVRRSWRLRQTTLLRETDKTRFGMVEYTGWIFLKLN